MGAQVCAQVIETGGDLMDFCPDGAETGGDIAYFGGELSGCLSSGGGFGGAYGLTLTPALICLVAEESNQNEDGPVTPDRARDGAELSQGGSGDLSMILEELVENSEECDCATPANVSTRASLRGGSWYSGHRGRVWSGDGHELIFTGPCDGRRGR